MAELAVSVIVSALVPVVCVVTLLLGATPVTVDATVADTAVPFVVSVGLVSVKATPTVVCVTV
jgi:hypothetical protein